MKRLTQQEVACISGGSAEDYTRSEARFNVLKWSLIINGINFARVFVINAVAGIREGLEVDIRCN